jgi:O-methyltransferase domain
VHDFFTTQPIKNAAVFFLRVIMHDWPDSRARMILLKLREAATEQTKLVLADFVLPLACADDVGSGTAGGEDAEVLDGVEGAESILAPEPLLANLGKASANAYWMDLTVGWIFWRCFRVAYVVSFFLES